MPSELFLDTSVLLNYVQVWLEGDSGSVAVIEGDDNLYICTAVADELEERCSTRRQIYVDLRKFVKQEDSDGDTHPVFNYEVMDFEHQNPNVNVTGNDRDHLLQLQMEFASIDDEDKFYELRKFIRSVRARQRDVKEALSAYSGEPKDGLADDINNRIGNRQDSTVLAQGAAWCDDDFGNTVVTLDREDMIDRESEINEVIEDYYSPSHHLRIIRPSAV